MFKKIIFILILVFNTVPAMAQQVKVTLNDAHTEQGELLGFNQQILFLKSHGKVLEIPMREVIKAVDIKTDEPINLVSKITPGILQATKPKKEFEVLNNISIQPFSLIPGVIIIEVEMRTTDLTSLAIRFINAGVLMDDWGEFPKTAYGAGLRYRFFLSELLGLLGKIDLH